jgi:hypothetical protein
VLRRLHFLDDRDARAAAQAQCPLLRDRHPRAQVVRRRRRRHGGLAGVRPPADFEGPSAVVWPTAGLEYGAVEDDTPPSPDRIARWIDAGIHVKGRPEWVFAKVYTHGIQYGRTLLGGRLDAMLGDLERTCRRRGISLHYMTAREAVNVFKAAEDGREGDPEIYRDYRFPKPRNMTSTEARP